MCLLTLCMCYSFTLGDWLLNYLNLGNMLDYSREASCTQGSLKAEEGGRRIKVREGEMVM